MDSIVDMALTNCTDYTGAIVPNHKEFIPNEHDLCHVCTCENGYKTACRSVSCRAPTTSCRNWIQLTDTCCHFECVGDGEGGSPGNYINTTNTGTVEPGDATDNITTVGLRLVGSTVTSFLVLALLLFMIHRLRKKRILLEMRRYNSRRRENMQDFDDSLTPEYFGIQCPPYEEPPPPYTPPKPTGRGVPLEAPPPYDAINNNVTGATTTIIRQSSNHGNNRTSSFSNYPQSFRQSGLSDPVNISLQQALNSELRESMHNRQQNIVLSSSSESSDHDTTDNSTQQTTRSSQQTSNTRGQHLRKSNTSVGIGEEFNHRRSCTNSDDLANTSRSRLGHSRSFGLSHSSTPRNGTSGNRNISIENNLDADNREVHSQTLLDQLHASCNHRNSLHNNNSRTLDNIRENSLQGHSLDNNNSTTLDNIRENSLQGHSNPTVDRLHGYFPPNLDDSETCTSDDDSNANVTHRRHVSCDVSCDVSSDVNQNHQCTHISNSQSDKLETRLQNETVLNKYPCRSNCGVNHTYGVVDTDSNPSVCSETGEHHMDMDHTISNDSQYPDSSIYRVQRGRDPSGGVPLVNNNVEQNNAQSMSVNEGRAALRTTPRAKGSSLPRVRPYGQNSQRNNRRLSNRSKKDNSYRSGTLPNMCGAGSHDFGVDGAESSQNKRHNSSNISESANESCDLSYDKSCKSQGHSLKKTQGHGQSGLYAVTPLIQDTSSLANHLPLLNMSRSVQSSQYTGEPVSELSTCQQVKELSTGHPVKELSRKKTKQSSSKQKKRSSLPSNSQVFKNNEIGPVK